MPGEALRLGPFRGGLNNASDPTAIGDTELSSCINFDCDVDGSLTSRPPMTNTSVAAGMAASGSIKVLGYYVSDVGTPYLLASQDTKLWYFAGGSWTSITTGFRATAMVQYLNKAWVVAAPGSASPGGNWVPTTIGAAGTWTAVAAMPKGGAATIYKERMFIAAGKDATTNESRFWFSNVADPAVWTGADFVDLVPGDGQKLIDMYVSANNIYLFKNDSIYRYTYDAAPTRGVIDPVSKTVGVSDVGCVVQYENVLFVYHEDYVYELINYNLTKLNIKVKFEPDPNVIAVYHEPNSLSIVGDRLIVRYFDQMYIFNLKTRTWSTWESVKNPGRWWTEPRPSNSSALPRYFSSSCVEDAIAFYMFIDGFNATESESMTCSCETRIFDFDSPEKFKKLYWWGIDIISVGTVVGTVVPVIYSFGVTWDSLGDYTWDDLAIYTWGQPGSVVPTVGDSQDTSGSIGRKFLKFLKAMRFRSVSFRISLTTTGTSATAPVKLFTINPVINLRQKVVKDIS